MVQNEVKAETGLEANTKLVHQVLRNDCKLSFVKAKKLNPQANSDRSLVIRQQYALKMTKLLEEGNRVINIDETWLN